METSTCGQRTHPLLQGLGKGGKPCSLGQGIMSWGFPCRVCAQCDAWQGGLCPTRCGPHSVPSPTPSLGAVSEVAAAGVIGTGTHNTGIKHGILPTQVRQQSVHRHHQHLEGFGEMSHHLVWCAQPGGEGEEHCKQDGSVLQGWGCWGILRSARHSGTFSSAAKT